MEHALCMHAYSFCTIPAEGIYDKEALGPLMEVIKKCHIYVIGYLPRIILKNAKHDNCKLILTYKICDEEYRIEYETPDDLKLVEEDDKYYLIDDKGESFWPSEDGIQSRLLHMSKSVNLNVKYIGQAYGTDGSRNAVDRLLKHETLQKISLKGVPEGYRLILLMLEIQPATQMITLFNPRAKNIDDDAGRIESGLDKLYGTTERERIALYEAALIRYFSPQFNKEFKNSFPSTSLKILQDCYSKDFGGVVAEIYIDELPFRLFSDVVDVSYNHIAKFNLHKDKDRDMFFGMAD